MKSFAAAAIAVTLAVPAFASTRLTYQIRDTEVQVAWPAGSFPLRYEVDRRVVNASPDAVNFTLYYEVPQFSARLSVAQRAGYDTTFPIAAGSCNPGACDSPLINDFVFSKSTLNVDGVFSWNFSDHLSARLEGLNLTNQTSNRYAYTANPVVTSYASTGRQITFGIRYKY